MNEKEEYKQAEKMLGKEKLNSIIDYNSFELNGMNCLRFKGNYHHLALFTIFIEKISSQNLEFEEKRKAWLDWRASFDFESFDLMGITLDSVDFEGAYLNNINFYEAHITNSNFEDAKIINCNFEETYHNKNNFKNCILDMTRFSYSNINNSKFIFNILRDTKIEAAFIDNVSFIGNNFKSTKFDQSTFKNVELIDTKTNSNTSFENINFDFHCVIRNLNVEIIQSDNESRSILKYIMRRSQWTEWCMDQKIANKKIEKRLNIRKYIFVKTFWSLSDYGYSTIRPLLFFFIFSFIFALMYFLLTGFSISWNLEVANQYSGPIYNLIPEDTNDFTYFHLIVRCLYFSIVTMTTLGFGDLFANSSSYTGMLLLIIQVLLGYFMLAVIVTRLSTIFNNNGPTFKPIRKYN